MDDKVFINETLINKINIGIVYYDATGKPIYANKAADRIFGLTIDKFVQIGAPEHGFEMIDYDGNKLPIEENPIEIVKRTKKPVTDIIAGILNKNSSYNLDIGRSRARICFRWSNSRKDFIYHYQY